MSQHSSAAPGLSRRALTSSAVWTVPVIAIAAAAPMAAASTAAPCTSVTEFSANNSGGNPAILTATSGTGTVSTIRITSVLAAGTTDTPANGQSYNMSTNGSGWAGNAYNGVNSEYAFSGFGPAGAIVLNQRREGPVTAPAGPGSDAQTLVFEFFDAAGAPFDPVDFQLTVFDITSNTDTTSWIPNYWDAVAFSTAPATISANGSSVGVGAGTSADPFRRATGSEYTTSTPRSDTFHFGVFPSGSTLTYTQHDGRQGWHFISLTDLRFGATDCA